MPKRIQNRGRSSSRRERKHVLSVNVMSPRIVMHSLLYKAKQLLIYGLVTCFLIVLCWAGFKGAQRLFIQGDRFQLAEITISPVPEAESFLTHTTLPELTGLEKGVSIFSYDPGDIEKRLQAMPETKNVKISRRYPGTIALEIEERVPVAKIELHGQKFLVDAEGYCFRSTLAVSSLWKRLPYLIPLYGLETALEKERSVLTDIGLLRALHLANLWHANDIPYEVSSIQVKDYNSLLMTTAAGEDVTFGYYEHERQMKDFLSVRSYARERGYSVNQMNLIPYKNIPVVFDQEVEQDPQPTSITPKRKSNFSTEGDILMILDQS